MVDCPPPCMEGLEGTPEVKEMTDTAEEPYTGGVQIPDLVKKKKKKRRLDRETYGQPAVADFHSPLPPNHSSIVSGRFDDQASEGSEIPRKKAKKKAREERSESWLDYSCVTTESELSSEAGKEVFKPKKKKKLGSSKPDYGDSLGVPLSLGKASSQPKGDGSGNGDWSNGGTPVKKRAKALVAEQDEASSTSPGPMKNGTDPTSADKHKEASHSSAEDSQVELFTSSPCHAQHSTLSQKKAATKLTASAELVGLVAPRKPHKHKKNSGVKDSDDTDVTPGKPHKRKISSDVEDFDSTNVTPRKPHKHKKSVMDDPGSSKVGFEAEETVMSVTGHDHIKNHTDVTPRKHKKSSGVEDPDRTGVMSRKPHKHKKSGTEDPDSSNVGFEAEETVTSVTNHDQINDSADVTSQKPHKHKKSTVKDPDSTSVAPRKPRKHKKSRMEDPDSSSVGFEVEETVASVTNQDQIIDSADVTSRKPHKHKKSRMEDPDSSNVGFEAEETVTSVTSHGQINDSADVTSRKPHKHKKSSTVEDSDSTGVIARKPHKHKESGMEDPDSSNVGFEAEGTVTNHDRINDDADVTSWKPRTRKKSSTVEDSDSTSAAPRKPRKHKKSGMEDPDSSNVGFEAEEKVTSVTNHDQINNSADVTSRRPHKHKKSSTVEDSGSTSVALRKPRKHKKSSTVEGSGSTSAAPRKLRNHKKSSTVEGSGSTSVVPRKLRKHKKSGMKDRNSSSANSPLEDSSELPKPPKNVRKSSSVKPPASASSSIEENESLDLPGFPLVDLETATRELEEFIPHVRSLTNSAIRQLASRDLHRFKVFKKKGVAVRYGSFTKQEDKQLKKNMEDFMKETGAESAEKLLFTYRFPAEQTDIKKLKAQHFFGIRIAEGIPRPWRLVYYRARKIYDPNNHGKRYSKKQKRKLLKYQAMYGNSWTKISELLARTSHSVAMKFAEMKCKPKTGPWSEEETKKLIQAVKETLQENCKEFVLTQEEGKDEGKALAMVRENLYKGIPWMKVEDKVGTRHWKQCKRKWLLYLTKKMSGGQLMARGTQNLQFKINLIKRLHELDVEDTIEVDWEDLSSLIGDVPPSYIRKRFYRLKASNVPHYNQKKYPEIINYLYEVTLPKLSALLKSKKGDDDDDEDDAKEQAPQVKEQKRVFRFQEIFPESSDELIDDSEDELEAEGSETRRKKGQS